MKTIIFNADVGEEAGFDDKIMQYISWCNIACGAHAGNDEVIKKTIDLAIQHDVKIGAHPSYPDRLNFGRTSMKMSYRDLVTSITEQILKVKEYTEKAGAELHHVKPHGALYNDAVKNKEIATAIIEVIKTIDKRLRIVTQKDSYISKLYDSVFNLKYEAFSDRNYNPDLTLVSRSKDNAIIENPKHVFDHVFGMVTQNKVKDINGEERAIFFDTICVHGDHPQSVEILKYMHQKFSELNFDL